MCLKAGAVLRRVSGSVAAAGLVNVLQGRQRSTDNLRGCITAVLQSETVQGGMSRDEKCGVH